MKPKIKVDEKKNTQNGITIVALIITIIVLLILAVVSIQAINGEGIIGHAKMAALKQEIAVLKEEYGLFCTEKIVETMGKFNKETVVASVDALVYNEREAKGKTIYDVMPSLKQSKYKDKTEIINGTIYVSTTNSQEAKILEEYGMIANPFKIVDGVLKSDDDNLALLGEDGILVIPASVKKIDTGAFSNLKLSNKNIKKVIIPGTVKEIGTNAFSNNETLEEVVMEEGVEIIGSSAFHNCTNLQRVQMADTVKIISYSGFNNCSKLRSINLSEGLEIIEKTAFHYCGLEELDLKNVKTVNANAFIGCSNLTTINISEYTQKIDESAFTSCSNITNITIDSNNPSYMSRNNMILSRDGSRIILISKGAIQNGILQIPSTLTTLRAIGYPSVGLRQINIPSTVTSIALDFFRERIRNVIINIEAENPNYQTKDNGVYSKDGSILYTYYKNDTKVEIQEGVKEISSYAFYRLTNLTELILPESIETIGTAILQYTKVESLNLGTKVQSIAPMIDSGSLITSIKIAEGNPNYVEENNIIYNKAKTKVIKLVRGTYDKVEISENVTEIGNSAFYSSTIYALKLPNTLQKLDGLYNVKGLTSIEIPSNVQTIGSGCFSSCPDLTTIIIHKKENSIPGAPWGSTIGDRLKIEWVG